MHKSPSLTVHTLRDVGKAPSYSHLHDEEELGEGDGEDGDGARVALARGVARQLEYAPEPREVLLRPHCEELVAARHEAAERADTRLLPALISLVDARPVQEAELLLIVHGAAAKEGEKKNGVPEPERDRRHLYCDVAGGDDKARAKNARRLPSKHLRHAANYGKGEGALDCCTRAKINCKCKPLLRTRVGPRV